MAFFFEKICYENVKSRLKIFQKSFQLFQIIIKDVKLKIKRFGPFLVAGYGISTELVTTCIQQMQKQFPSDTTFI